MNTLLVTVLFSMVALSQAIMPGNKKFLDSLFQHRIRRQNGGLSQEDIQSIVDEHNRYRSLVGSGPVVWDANLAANAQSWSDRCILSHSTTRGFAGENIFAAPFYRGSIGAAAARFWYSESSQSCCATSLSCCGHYRQLVSPSTTRVGCGFTACSSISYAPGQRYMFVCQYTPAWQFGK